MTLHREISEILIFTTYPGIPMYSCRRHAQDKSTRLKGQESAEIQPMCYVPYVCQAMYPGFHLEERTTFLNSHKGTVKASSPSPPNTSV